MEWVAQSAVYVCRIFGQDTTVKFKESDIPSSILERYAANLQHDEQVQWVKKAWTKKHEQKQKNPHIMILHR